MSQSDHPVDAIEQADSGALAARVGRASDAELAAGMSDPVARKAVLDQVFARMADHVDAEQIAGLDAIVHFKITDAPGGGADLYEAVFREGAVALSPKPTTERPKLRVTVPPVLFLKLVTGHESARAALVSGKVKVWGNLVLARRMQTFFRIPASGSRPPDPSG